MAKRRQVFYSFHYKPDNWRAAQIRNLGLVQGNRTVSDNEWETVARGGDAAIQKWIDGQMHRKSCAIILIGSGTAGRKWIRYEIEKAWSDGKGLLGIYIHNLEDVTGNQSRKGRDPLYSLYPNGRRLSNIVKSYDPPYKQSTRVYAHIQDNIADWIEEAIRIREKY